LNDLNYNVNDLIRLQQIDNMISHNLLEVEKIKDNEELKSRTEELDENTVKLNEEKDRLAALENQRKKFEDNISLKAEKIKKNESRLSSGTITNAKELVSLQEEIVSLKNITEELENKMLDIMIEIDDKAEETNDLQEIVGKLGSYVSNLSEEIDMEVSKIEKINKELEALKEKVVKRIPQKIYEDYESLKKRKANIAVGYIKDNICSACNMELSVSDRAHFKDGGLLYRCPLCRRTVILHNKEVDSIEDELSGYKI
jgi:uncharacterized protein